MQLGFAAFFWLFVASSFVLAAAAADEEKKPCTVHDNGKFYDLNPLKSRIDYQIVTRSGRKLSLNVCQSVKTETFGLKDGIDASAVGGFIRLDHGDFSIGKFNTSLSVFDSRPQFVMADGSRCRSGGGQTADIRASSVVEFSCDPSVAGFGHPQLVASLPPGDEETACAYVIEWKTSYACPTYENGGFWRFITNSIVTLLILSMTYMILGTLYNRFALDLRGYDQIPQFSLESMKYHVIEGFEWARDMAGILYVNFFHNHHRSLINNNARTPNPVSHQAQVSSGLGSSSIRDLEQQGPADHATTTAATTSAKTHAIPNHMLPRPVTTTTNPVSHHTQTATLSQSPPRLHQSTTTATTTTTPQSSSTPTPTPITPQGGGGGASSSSGSTDRGEFILVDDHDSEDVQAPETEIETRPAPAPAPAHSA